MNTFTIVENIISPSAVSRLLSGLSQISSISNISVIPQLGKVSFRFEDRNIHMEVIRELQKLGFPPKGNR